jgi:hypothetical protein
MLNHNVTLLCSSSFASNPCTNPSVRNLRVCPLETLFKDPILLCEVQISPKMFVPIVEPSLEGGIPS